MEGRSCLEEFVRWNDRCSIMVEEYRLQHAVTVGCFAVCFSEYSNYRIWHRGGVLVEYIQQLLEAVWLPLQAAANY